MIRGIVDTFFAGVLHTKAVKANRGGAFMRLEENAKPMNNSMRVVDSYVSVVFVSTLSIW